MKNGFVVINNIRPVTEYIARMEALFCTRQKEIDKVDGFRSVRILKPRKAEEPYLVISEWDSEQHYLDWTQSEAFRIGHKRAMLDMENARNKGEQAPMQSHFSMYEILTD